MWDIIRVTISYPTLRKSWNIIGNVWFARNNKSNIVLYVVFSSCDLFSATKTVPIPLFFLWIIYCEWQHSSCVLTPRCFCCQATLDVVMNLQFHYIEKLWQSFWSPKAPPSDGPTALPSRYSPAFPAPFLGDMFLFKMHKVFLGFLSALENLEVFSALQSRDKERRKCLIL